MIVKPVVTFISLADNIAALLVLHSAKNLRRLAAVQCMVCKRPLGPNRIMLVNGRVAYHEWCYSAGVN